jgi:hypothetical protein
MNGPENVKFTLGGFTLTLHHFLQREVSKERNYRITGWLQLFMCDRHVISGKIKN